MNHPYLFVAGVTIFSLLAPELLVAFKDVGKIPPMFNLLSAIAGGLIASAFVL